MTWFSIKTELNILLKCGYFEQTWTPFCGHLNVGILIKCFIIHAPNEVVIGAGIGLNSTN
jgi:hypothetical protein